MTDLALLVAVIGVCGLLGVCLHELTHYLVWLAGGRQPHVKIWPPTVYIPPSGFKRVEMRDRVAAGAPLAIGSAVAVVGLAIGMAVSLPAVAAWIGYTTPTRDLGLIFADASASR